MEGKKMAANPQYEGGHNLAASSDEILEAKEVAKLLKGSY